MDKEKVPEAFKNDILVKMHAYDKMKLRNISISDLEDAITSDGIIEDYPDDFPLPSSLILGKTNINDPLHIVCAISDNKLIIITAYRPDPTKWNENYQVRKT